MLFTRGCLGRAAFAMVCAVLACQCPSARAEEAVEVPNPSLQVPARAQGLSSEQVPRPDARQESEVDSTLSDRRGTGAEFARLSASQLIPSAANIWRAALPVSFAAGQPEPSPSKPSAAPVPGPGPKQPGWAKRHSTLLAGLALTGAGTAMLATGGPGQSNGSCSYLSGVGTYCQPPGPIWLGKQRFAGLMIDLIGVPVTIIGLIKH